MDPDTTRSGIGGAPNAQGSSTGAVTTGGVTTAGVTTAGATTAGVTTVGVGGSTSGVTTAGVTTGGVGGSTAAVTTGATTGVTTGGTGGSTSAVTTGATTGGSTGTTMTTLIDGSPCSSASECLSASCVDGVCCNTACLGTCVACSAAKKGAGADGTCGAIVVGDPDNECDPQLICGKTGVCSGFGSCAVAPAATSCASCGAEGYVVLATCDGSGTCGKPAQTSCGFFRCSTGACLTTCTGDVDCITGAFCSNLGVCGPKLSNGDPCTTPNACGSGFCADGFCCDTVCNGPCVACSKLINPGGVNGVCTNIAAGTDPQNECKDAQTPCEPPGFCNGSGACAPPPVANTFCGNGTCSPGTPSVSTDPSLCDGNGICKPGATHTCTAACAGIICDTACVTDADCPNPITEYCTAGKCAPKKSLGVTCGAAKECAVGNCVEGVCCDSACNSSACKSCLAAKGASSDGTCTALNGPPPAGACDDQQKCTDNVCNGGACANPARTCAAAATCTVAGTCDPATGACKPPTALTCPMAAVCEIAGTCDPITGVCAPSGVSCPLASDACHIAATCDLTSGKCGAETVKECKGDGLAVCDTLVCDLSQGGACVVRSKLDGAKCVAGEHDGICVAGSCFTVAGSNGSGGAGGTMSTSNATGAHAATGGGGEAGAGGGGFHFAGGACSIVDDVNSEDGRLAWLLAGLLVAARQRPRRASAASRRGSRNA